MRRPVLLAIAGVVALLVLIVGVVLWRRGRVDPLPPPVRTAVTNEQHGRARVDSQLIADTLKAVAAQQRQAVAEARAAQLRDIAHRFSDYADSLARKAELAQTAQDSASYYRSAYLVRTDERDTLLHALAEKDTALRAANERAASFRRGLLVADSARQRADSVLDAVVQSVTVCTVPGSFGRLKCPSRKTALAVGIISGLATEELYRAVKDGRIRIALPFLRSDRR